MCYSQLLNKVLVIDDDESVFSNIQKKLEKSNPLDIVLHAVIDPLCALSKIREHRPQLVLLDYKIPKMNGIEVMKEINGLPERLQPLVVFLSNVAEHRAEAIELGAVDYLVKADVTLGRIVDMMNQLLSQHAENDSSVCSREILETECFIDSWEDE